MDVVMAKPPADVTLAIERTKPLGYERLHEQLFELARRLKAAPGFDPAQVPAVVAEWYGRSQYPWKAHYGRQLPRLLLTALGRGYLFSGCNSR
jgi:hypothetical protein